MIKNNTWIGLLAVVIVIGAGFFYTQNKGIDNDDTVSSGERLTQTLLVGTWKSIDDERSYVVYGSDGLMADIYDGEELSRGSWEVLSGDGETFRVLQGTEVFDYSIVDLNESELTMIYLDHGNILRYQRVDTHTTE